MSLPLDARVGAGRLPHLTPARALFSPYAIGAAVLVICAVLLTLPIALPIGPMYWDVVVFIDGGWRVLNGQMPSIDFFAPVGPLGYWLFAAGLKFLPQAQPVLLAQWMVLPVTLAGLLPVLARIDQRSRRLSLALLLPFLVFQLLPTNVEQFSSFPGIDGFGIYNRHMAQMLYVLTVALLFERRQGVLLFVIAWSCAALFLLKITGFVCAGMLCAFAFAAGRVRLATAVGALLVFALALGALEVSLGIVSAYIHDIVTLVSMNEEVLLPRLIQAASIHFGVVGSGALLTLVLLWTDRNGLKDAALAAVRQPFRAGNWTALLDRDVVWLGVALFVGIFSEAQNTGGHGFLFVWPVLVRIACNATNVSGRATATILVLIAAVALPPLVNVLHRTTRAMVVQLKYDRVPLDELRALNSVKQRPEMTERATQLQQHYARFPETYQALADSGQLPSFFLYSDLDFQSGWLMSANEGAQAVRAYEAAHGVRFDTIMSLNFVNPFPYALQRQSTPHIAIGADPFRAVPPPNERTLEAVRQTDLVLLPLCPITVANQKLKAIYAEGLKDHVEVSLSPCWTGFIRPGLVARP